MTQRQKTKLELAIADLVSQARKFLSENDFNDFCFELAGFEVNFANKHLVKPKRVIKTQDRI